jgi:Ca2+-binding RTX toxin-like protein
MKIDGSGLGAGDSLTFDGSQEIKGHFTIAGGAGADVLTGGQGGNAIDGGKGQDTITGGLGDDAITGGGGQDTLSGGSNGNDSFVYNAVSDSTGVHFDTVVGFDVTRDNFNVMTGVTGIDAAINGGALSDHHSATFNNELAAAVDAAHLQANHAVLFTPDSGSLAGDVFLVVDQNGIAGYQTNQDLVIEISGSGNIASLSVQNFM